MHDDIAAMPMAYGTLIGDMGTVLSGGQKQRVLIARALYREPVILFSTKRPATSTSAARRRSTTPSGARSMTRMIVAHRPETIRASSRVIVLERGKVAEDIRRALPAPKAAA